MPASKLSDFNVAWSRCGEFTVFRRVTEFYDVSGVDAQRGRKYKEHTGDNTRKREKHERKMRNYEVEQRKIRGSTKENK